MNPGMGFSCNVVISLNCPRIFSNERVKLAQGSGLSCYRELHLWV